MNQKLETVRPGVQGVRALEEEAARLLEDARAEGARLLREARRQAEEIAAADPPAEEVDAQCAARVAAANKEARRRVQQAEAEAGALRERSAGKIDACAGQIVRIVSGGSP
jgi:cell division septum initiation protein DivIVA